MRKGLELVLGATTASGLIVAVVGLGVLTFGWNGELMAWGLISAGCGGAIAFLSYCILKGIERDHSAP